MNYNYSTVKENISIEISEEWVEILKEMDREWKRTAHNQDRKEVSYMALEGYCGRASYEDDPLTQTIEQEYEIEAEIFSEKLMEQFTEKEKLLLQDMMINPKNGSEYAKEICTHASVVYRRKKNIREKTKKFYENSEKKLFFWR